MISYYKCLNAKVITFVPLQGVAPVIVSSFHDALHPLGGVKVLCINCYFVC